MTLALVPGSAQLFFTFHFCSRLGRAWEEGYSCSSMVDSFQVGCFTITNLVSNGTLHVLEGDYIFLETLLLFIAEYTHSLACILTSEDWKHEMFFASL